MKQNPEHTSLKNKYDTLLKKSIGFQYLFVNFFWSLLILALIFGLYLFINERTRITSSSEYKTAMILFNNSVGEKQEEAAARLLAIRFPIIDFSLLSFSFFNNTNPNISKASVWTQKQTSMDAAYSYIFITIIIAVITLIFYLLAYLRYFRCNHFNKKHHLYYTTFRDYRFFSLQTYISFATNLTIVFSFFNFLSSIILICYGLFLVIFCSFLWYVLKINTEILLERKWWKNPNFILLASIFVFQNAYNLGKGILLNKVGLNIDLILTLILPFGTITLFLGILIRNMLASKVSNVKKSIRNMTNVLNSFHTFVILEEENALTDYSFVSALPKVVLNIIKSDVINHTKTYLIVRDIHTNLNILQDACLKTNRMREFLYLSYSIFNEVTNLKEITEIVENNQKIVEICQK